MAKPIKETPYLKGKDARVFVNENRNIKKVSTEERKKIKESYDSLMSIAQFEV